MTELAAAVVSPAEYGAFQLTFPVYGLVIALTQGPCGQVLVIRYSAAGPGRRPGAAAAAGGVAVLLGALPGLITLAIAAFLTMPLRGVLLAVAVLLPALALQATWRTALVSRGSQMAAFANDLVWTLLQAVAVGGSLVLEVDARSPLCWHGPEQPWWPRCSAHGKTGGRRRSAELGHGCPTTVRSATRP